jgi:hypothetical protein
VALVDATVTINREQLTARILRGGAREANRRAERLGAEMKKRITQMISSELGPGKGPEDSAKRGMKSMRAITWVDEVDNSAGSFPIIVTLGSPDLDGPTGRKFGALNYGNGGHGIDVKDAPWLIFEGTNKWAGQIIKTKHVNHPGHTGKQWLKRTIALTQRRFI